MDAVKPVNDYTFHVETEAKRLHLVVSRSSVENVCRLETPKNLRNFIQNGDAHLFKGRLQLQSKGEWVTVLVKGEKVGKIGKMVIRDWLISD